MMYGDGGCSDVHGYGSGTWFGMWQGVCSGWVLYYIKLGMRLPRAGVYVR